MPYSSLNVDTQAKPFIRGTSMRKIATIGTVCALAFAGLASAQEAPAKDIKIDLSGAAAKEASPEAKQLVGELVAALKETMAIFSSIKDKATADAAVAKLEALKTKSDALQEKLQKLPQEEMEAAMQASGPELFGIILSGAATVENLKKNDYFGSEALKALMAKEEAENAQEAPATMEL